MKTNSTLFTGKTISYTVSRSAVMNLARKICAHVDWSWSKCLTQAWHIEKQNAKYAAEKAEREAESKRVEQWQASDEYKALDKTWRPNPDTMHDFYQSDSYKGD